MLKTLPVDIQLHLMQFLSARDIAAVGEVSPGEWLYFKLRFLMMSDFLRQTSLRPDEIAAQTLLEDKVKDRGCSFSVLSMNADNRKYRKTGSNSKNSHIS